MFKKCFRCYRNQTGTCCELTLYINYETHTYKVVSIPFQHNKHPYTLKSFNDRLDALNYVQDFLDKHPPASLTIDEAKAISPEVKVNLLLKYSIFEFCPYYSKETSCQKCKECVIDELRRI